MSERQRPHQGRCRGGRRLPRRRSREELDIGAYIKPRRDPRAADKDLGDAIKRTRKEILGLSRPELSTRLSLPGCSRGAIEKWEHAQNRPPRRFLEALEAEARLDPGALTRRLDRLDRWTLPDLPVWLRPRQRIEFVGRDAELARLRQAWARVTEGGAELVQVVGERTIGKTTLLGRFVAEVVAAEGLVLAADFDGAADGAYQSMARTFEHLCDACPPARVGTLSDRARTAADVVAPGFLGRKPRPQPPRAPTPDAVFAGLVELFAAAAASNPVLLVLDNVHLAGDDTCALLTTLIGSMPPHLMVVATRTAADPSPAVLAALEAPDRAEAVLANPPIQMRRLTGPELKQLTRRRATAAGAPAVEPTRGFTELLRQKSNGNPQQAEKFLSDLIEHVAPGTPIGGAASAKVLRARPAPPSLAAWYHDDIQRLSPLARTALDHAAAFGVNPDPVIVAEACGVPADDAFAAAWDELLRIGLIERRDHGVFEFPHSTLREALHGVPSHAHRRRVHAGVARALEARWRTDPGAASVTELADHWFEATIGGDRSKAIEFGVHAIDEALQQAATKEALRRIGALLNLRLSTTDRARLHIRKAEIDARNGKLKPARELFRGVAENPAVEVEVRADAAIGWGKVSWLTNASFPALEAALEQIRELLPEEEIDRHARLVTALGRDLKGPEDRARIPALSRLALDLAHQSQRPETLAEAYSLRVEVLLEEPDLDARLEAAETMYEHAVRAADPFLVVQALNNLFAYHLAGGSLGDALGTLALIETYGEEHHLPLAELITRTHRLGLDLFQRPLDEPAAETRALDNCAFGEKLGYLDAELLRDIALGYLWRERGHLEDIEPWIKVALKRLKVIVYRPTYALGLLEAKGKPRDGEALDHLAIVEQTGLAALDKDGSWVLAMCFLAEAYTYLALRPQGEVVYDLLLPWREHGSIAYNGSTYFGSVEYHLGMLRAMFFAHELAAEDGGELADEHFAAAEEHFEAAKARDRAMRSKTWRAHTLAVHSQMLELRGGRVDLNRARRFHRRALAIARELGLVKLEAELTGERRRHLPGGRRR